MTLLATLCLPAQATTLAVESMTITGASCWASVNGFPTLVNLAPGPAATLDDGVVNGVIDADGQHGSASNPVVSGVSFGMPLNGFFAHSATGTGEWLALPLDGGPATFRVHLNWTAAGTPGTLAAVQS
jgi:hypothetical protein